MPRRKKLFTGTFLIAFLILDVLFPLSWNTHSASGPTSLLDEAKRLSWLGNWDAAAPLFERAERLFKIEGRTRDEAYTRIGRIRAKAETMSQLEVAHLLAQELANPLLQEDKDLRLWCLMAKAAVDFNFDSASAKQDWTEALQLAKVLGEKQWASRATGELGIIAFVEGNTPLAVNNIGQAIKSAYWSGDTGALIDFISIAGIGFTEEKRFDEALPLLKYAIKISERTEGAGFPWLAYQGLAAVLIARGERDESWKVLQRVLSTARLQNQRGQEAQIFVLLGDLSMASSNVEQARQYFEEAGHLFTSIRWDRGLDEAMLKLSSIYRSQGKLEQAAEALRIGLKSKPGIDRYYQPRALTALAELRVAQNRPSEANALFERAEDVTEAILINLHSGFEEAAVAGSLSETYLAHFQLAVQQNNIPTAFRTVERVRGRATASLLYAKSGKDTESATATTLNSKISSIQRQLMETTDTQSRSRLLESLYRYERELAFEDSVSKLDQREFRQDPPVIASVQHILRDDEVLIEYVLAEPAFCIAISKQRSEIIPLPADGKRIEILATLYLADIKARRAASSAAHELYTILVEQLLSKFPQNRLIISPDGSLRLIPFESLRGPSGDFLIRSKTISYASGTLLWAVRTAPTTAGSRALLVVGDVNYSAAFLLRGLADFSGNQLESLPNSRDEVLSIARISDKDAVLLTGKEATETAFKAQPLSEYRVIHLAVHAMPDPQYPLRAAVVLNADAQNDGLLQVREILRMHLQADLVSLSACETAVGTAQGEAGMASLEQAFLAAGARATVGSLWNVEDYSTSALMKKFYERLARGEEKAMALRQAKLSLLERNRDMPPYYWAAFTLQGEGSGVISLAPTWH